MAAADAAARRREQASAAGTGAGRLRSPPQRGPRLLGRVTAGGQGCDSDEAAYSARFLADPHPRITPGAAVRALPRGPDGFANPTEGGGRGAAARKVSEWLGG